MKSSQPPTMSISEELISQTILKAKEGADLRENSKRIFQMLRNAYQD